jgi:hypothetical protein
MSYYLHGGDHGNYQITADNNATRLAFVRRNQKGGGYTATLADRSTSIQLHHLPKAERNERQAELIMAKLTSLT